MKSNSPIFAAPRLALVALLTLTTASAYGQNLIQNGDFSVNASSYGSFPGYDGGSNPAAPTDWTLTGGTLGAGAAGLNGPDTGVGNVFGPNSLNVNTGGSVSAFAFLQQDPTISQMFSVVAGETYALDYDAASRGIFTSTSNNSFIFTTVTDDDVTKTLLFAQSGTLQDDQFYANTTPGLLLDTAGTGNTFTADQTGAVTLTFTSQAPLAYPGGDHAIDIAEVSVMQIPEPSALAMAAAGLGLLALSLRLRLLAKF